MYIVSYSWTVGQGVIPQFIYLYILFVNISPTNGKVAPFLEKKASMQQHISGW